MKIVCVLKSEASYERIKTEINNDDINWTLENSIDKLRLTLAVDFYDIAIVDHSIESYDEFIELLDLKNVKILNFRGKYDEVIESLIINVNEYFKKEKEEEREYKKQLKNRQAAEEQHPNSITIQQIVKTERIEVPVYQNVANTLISVVNLSERAGSTFISSNIARAFAINDVPVTLYENPLGTLDAYYTMELYLEEERYYSYRQNIRKNGQFDKKKLPKVNGVTVAAIEPDYKEWEEKDTLRLLAGYTGINIVDVGWNYNNESIIDILKVSQTILVVVDPLATQIVRNDKRLEHFEELKKQGLNVKYVFNKWNECIGKRKFIEGFGIKPFLIIDYYEPRTIYNTYYKRNFEFLIDQENIGENLLNNLMPLLKGYVPTERQPKKRRFLTF